jgi:hypothetical protein
MHRETRKKRRRNRKRTKLTEEIVGGQGAQNSEPGG